MTLSLYAPDEVNDEFPEELSERDLAGSARYLLHLARNDPRRFMRVRDDVRKSASLLLDALCETEKLVSLPARRSLRLTHIAAPQAYEWPAEGGAA